MMDHDDASGITGGGRAVGRVLRLTSLANAVALAAMNPADWGEPKLDFGYDFPNTQRIPTDPSQSIYTTHFAPSLPRPREPKPTAVAKRRANAKAARKARKQNRK